MPKAPPPGKPVGEPRRHTLPALTSLERIHSNEFDAAEFNPTVPGPGTGGRFDSIDGDYAYLYAGEDIDTAVEETLLRDVPQQAGQPRQLPRAQLEGRTISHLTTAGEIPLTDLRERGDLGAVGQDEWLVHCDSIDYQWTREWARAIRQWDEDAAGFVWKSRRSLSTDAYVFFADRLRPESILPRGDGLPIDRGPGRALIDAGLRRASATVV
jgi:RES domain